MLHLNRDRQNLGQFSPEEVAEGLRTGRFVPTDLAWREGMESWQPLSTFTDLPIAEEPVPAMPDLPPASPEEVFPWENREKIGIFTALFETIFQSLGKPAALFERLSPTQNLLTPYAFYLLVAIPSFAVYFAECMMFVNYAITTLSSNPEFTSNPETAKGLQVLKSMNPFWFSFVALVQVSCIPFISAGIYHLFLMLFGGAKESFLKTFAVTCYVFGAVSPMMMLPCCGPFAAVIWGLISISLGLAAAHRTQTWRATLSVVIPFLLCCGGYLVLNVLSTAQGFPGTGLHP